MECEAGTLVLFHHHPDRDDEAIERLLSRQGSNDSFGLWSPGGEDPWLDAYVTDFLTRGPRGGG